MPPFIAYGIVCGISNPLNLGLQVILIPKFAPSEFDKLIVKYKPQHVLGVPSFWEALAASKRLQHVNLSFLQNGITGGDRIDPTTEFFINDFLHAHHCPYNLNKGYGMTELSSTAAYSVCDECNLPGSVGIPLFRNSVKIVEPGTQIELPFNEIGEICMTSPTLVLGYYANPDATNETFVTDGHGLRWIHTQDIGYINENGVLFIVDRMKRMIARSDGFKVYPSVIENVIMRCNAVAACAVVGAQEGNYRQGMVPKAFVELRKEYVGLENNVCEELEARCRKELAEYAQPSDYVFLDTLPLTPIGKIDYLALECEEAEQHAKDNT